MRIRVFAIALTLMTALVLTVASGGLRAAQGSAGLGVTGQETVTRMLDGNWDTLTVDMIVKRRTWDGYGRESGTSGNTTTVHLERSNTTGAWKSRAVLIAPSTVPLRTFGGSVAHENQSSGMRIEDDEDGSAVRVYTRAGLQLELPDNASLSKLLGISAAAMQWAEGKTTSQPSLGNDRTWIRAFLLPVEGQDARKRALELQLGAPKGQVGTLLRYVSESAGNVREVLIDPAIGVPVEVNLAQAGRLVSHVQIVYGPIGQGAIARTRITAEMALTAEGTDRHVVEVDFSSIRLERRGQQ